MHNYSSHLNQKRIFPKDSPIKSKLQRKTSSINISTGGITLSIIDYALMTDGISAKCNSIGEPGPDYLILISFDSI